MIDIAIFLKIAITLKLHIIFTNHKWGDMPNNSTYVYYI